MFRATQKKPFYENIIPGIPTHKAEVPDIQAGATFWVNGMGQVSGTYFSIAEGINANLNICYKEQSGSGEKKETDSSMELVSMTFNSLIFNSTLSTEHLFLSMHKKKDFYYITVSKNDLSSQFATSDILCGPLFDSAMSKTANFASSINIDCGLLKEFDNSHIVELSNAFSTLINNLLSKSKNSEHVVFQAEIKKLVKSIPDLLETIVVNDLKKQIKLKEIRTPETTTPRPF